MTARNNGHVALQHMVSVAVSASPRPSFVPTGKATRAAERSAM